jgi:hypothetical protein
MSSTHQMNGQELAIDRATPKDKPGAGALSGHRAVLQDRQLQLAGSYAALSATMIGGGAGRLASILGTSARTLYLALAVSQTVSQSVSQSALCGSPASR